MKLFSFFFFLFSETSLSSSKLLNVIPPLVTDEDNINLEADPMDGIWKVVFEMDGEIAVGPDGFTDKFFTYT